MWFEYNFYNGYDPTAIPILKNKTWDNKTFKVKISHEIRENVYISLEYQNSKIIGYSDDLYSAQYYLDKFTPDFLHGINNTLSTSLNIGF